MSLSAYFQNKVNANSAQTKATNSADDSDGSDGDNDEEEQDANKTHDEVGRQKCRFFSCFPLNNKCN